MTSPAWTPGAMTTFADGRQGVGLPGAAVGEHLLDAQAHRDSCHRVWFELHEDLIATLGLTR